ASHMSTVYPYTTLFRSMLTSTVGLGAICGASWMVLRSAITGLANVVLVCTLIMSLAILAFTATDAFYLALPCVFVAGAMMTITRSEEHTSELQSLTTIV